MSGGIDHGRRAGRILAACILLAGLVGAVVDSGWWLFWAVALAALFANA